MLVMANALAFAANTILDLIPAAEINAIQRDLHPVSFALNETIYETGATLREVYFPTTAVLSVLKVMSNGSAVETTAIGREGMAGIRAIFHAERAGEKMIAQVSGDAYGMLIAAFQEHYRLRSSFRAILENWCVKTFDSLSQSIACNRLHHVNERCAKWLLLTQDRVGASSFPMTQEFLSMMLGVNRAAVSVAESTHQLAGLIHYSRGRVTIHDRKGLEHAACECYAALEKDLDLMTSAGRTRSS
jgi:CRP-like cAMP-binding protein